MWMHQIKSPHCHLLDDNTTPELEVPGQGYFRGKAEKSVIGRDTLRVFKEYVLPITYPGGDRKLSTGSLH